ncbi:MAG TPA: hypothetical protein VLL25_18555 [Acidimicrobiales bacterium]|nr:hypothetical protein [Acidimicrobiales bacterium]
MKVTQYMTAEKGIAAADGGGIRQRWMYGLRLLRDPQAISNGNGGLRHGVADTLIDAAHARGLKLSDREIRYRLQCARTYPTESQIGKILADFQSWWSLMAARFPPTEAEPDEPPADHRTETERRHDKARQLALAGLGDQGRLFPLDEFEPMESTLKDLVDYASQMEDLTARFAKVDRDRRAYLKTLMEAVNYDLSQTWQAAHMAAYGTEPDVA